MYTVYGVVFEIKHIVFLTVEGKS